MSLIWQPTFLPFAKARKRVETLFSQMVDQFMLCRNYAKQQVGLFARIISKVSALTILQCCLQGSKRRAGRQKDHEELSLESRAQKLDFRLSSEKVPLFLAYMQKKQ